jgi:hypothetical protein
VKKQQRVLAAAACAAAACIAVAAVLVVSAFGATARPSPQDQVFSGLNAGNVDNAQARINGSANAHNQIPVGTVLTYKTSTGNLGKLQILKYGYNLRIRWVTYRPNGTVLSSGKNLLIRGTYAYDLDQGKATGPTSPPADFWWEQTTPKLRYLVAQNGASFTIASYQRCELARPGPGQSECPKKP